MNEVVWDLVLIRFAAILFFVYAGVCFLVLAAIVGIALYVHIVNVRELGPAEKDFVAKIVMKAKGGEKDGS